MPTSTATWVEAFRTFHGLTNWDVVRVAIKQSRQELQQLFSRGLVVEEDDFGPSRPRQRVSDEPLTPLSCRLRPSDLDTLDTLVETAGATSRSYFVSVVLEALMVAKGPVPTAAPSMPR